MFALQPPQSISKDVPAAELDRSFNLVTSAIYLITMVPFGLLGLTWAKVMLNSLSSIIYHPGATFKAGMAVLGCGFYVFSGNTYLIPINSYIAPRGLLADQASDKTMSPIQIRTTSADSYD